MEKIYIWIDVKTGQMEEFLPEFLRVERDGDQKQEKPLRAPSSLSVLMEAGKVMVRKEDQPRKPGVR